MYDVVSGITQANAYPSICQPICRDLKKVDRTATCQFSGKMKRGLVAEMEERKRQEIGAFSPKHSFEQRGPRKLNLAEVEVYGIPSGTLSHSGSILNLIQMA